MRYLTFGDNPSAQYDYCLLFPSLSSTEIRRYYIDEFFQGQEHKVIAYDLYKQNKRTPVKLQREYIDEFKDTVRNLGIKYFIVCDGEYFKTMSGESKVETNLGYVLEHGDNQFISYAPNFQRVFYDPDKIKSQIHRSLTAIIDHSTGAYSTPGKDIIKTAHYANTNKEAFALLEMLEKMDVDLTCDIEAFSLKHNDAGIGTISFAWNQHEGVAMRVDLLEDKTRIDNKALKIRLAEFFRRHKQKMIYHNISYDVYVMIYELFMGDILDTDGLLKGLSVMLKNWECTQLISYLATNSCAGNKLGLKSQSQEFSGNYAEEDIHDITLVDSDKILPYNLVDCLSTWYTYNKNYPIMVQDQQLNIYQTLFQPSIVDIIQMQLTGLPIDMGRVEDVAFIMQEEENAAATIMKNHPLIKAYLKYKLDEHVDKRNSQLKTKVVTAAEEAHKISWNPNSNNQLQEFLYSDNYLGLPILERTDAKAPATGKDVLSKLKNHTEDPVVLAFLDALINYKQVNKILTSFIPAFLGAARGPDGWHYLFGSFKLGGTLSGRLSSANPNLQNIPSSSRYSKLIKSCFKAPPGWLFVGLDFASLEDRISALTTRDPEKLKVYTDGYDGHCLRAYTYFSDQMTGIDPTSVESINSIKKSYPALRNKSKAPTFAMTYLGTQYTLIQNCGFTPELADSVYNSFQEMYKVSVKYVDDKLKQAEKDGYVTCAFGLRVRTPLLGQSIRGTKRTPYEVDAEGRSAGNALGQSWCLLNNRAGVEYMGKVRASKYKLDIRPCAHIHDAQYFMIKDNINTVMFMNEHLVEAVNWNDHPDIYHPQVGLGGEVSIFHPNWAHELELPNNASKEEIISCCREFKKKVLNHG